MQWKGVILFDSTYNISIFAFRCFSLIFTTLMAPIEGFKEEGCEGVMDGRDTALHKRRDFSSRRVRFCKSEDFSDLYIGKMCPFGSGLLGIAHGGGRRGSMLGGETRNFKISSGVRVHVAHIVFQVLFSLPHCCCPVNTVLP